MAYQARERRQPKHHCCFSRTCYRSNFAHYFLNSSFHFISKDMESKLDSVVEMAEVAKVDVHRTFDDQPIKAHKSKKHGKYRNKAGRVSMAPPSLDPPSKRACQDIAEGVPQSMPRRNKSCFVTYPGKNQRPTARSIDQQGDDWRVDDGNYDSAYDDSYEDSWHHEPRRRFTP
jgi:hypothetical protein